MADEYLVNIVLKARDEGMAAWAEMGTALATLVAEAKLVSEELKHLNETAREHGNALHNMSLDTKRAADEAGRLADSLASKLTPAFNNVNQAAGGGGAAGGFMAFVNAIVPGGATAATATVIIAGLATAFLPLTVAIVSATVALAVFAVGAAATIAVMVLFAGAIGALAAGVAWLGSTATPLVQANANLATATTNHTAAVNALANAHAGLANVLHPTQVQLALLNTLQQDVTTTGNALAAAQLAQATAFIAPAAPLAILKQHLADLKDRLGALAEGPANQIFVWLDKLLPLVEKVGTQLINWFGPRLPQILDIAGKAIAILVPITERFGGAMGKLLDEVIAHSPTFLHFFDIIATFGADAMVGLLNNLFRLSTWFLERLPLFDPILHLVFDNGGILLMKFFELMGRFVDWILQNWPAIVATVQSWWDMFVFGYNIVAPLIAEFQKHLQDLAPDIEFIKKHADDFKAALVFLGIVIGLTIVIIIEIIAIAIVLITTFLWVIETTVKLWKATEVMRDLIGMHFKNLGTGANNLKNDIGHAFDVIGSAAASLGEHIGVAFNNIGQTIHDSLNRDIQIIDDFLDLVSKIPGMPLWHIPLLPEGPVMNQSIIHGHAAGGKTSGSMAIVGEGRAPEYVIPTDPQYRGNAVGLWMSAGRELQLMAGGGVLDAPLGAARSALGAVGPWGQGVGGAVVDRLGGLLQEIWTKFLTSSFASSVGGAGTIGGNLAAWIMQAIALTGVPASWAGGLGVLIMRESGGNPRAINLTDSNAAMGDPSRGLMQTIGSTFNAYHLAGTSLDIYDPVANIAAGIRYILSRYGGIGNVQQANPNLPPRGYDQGGYLPPGGTYAWNGTGRTETVTPAVVMDDVVAELRGIRQLLAQLAGQPRLGAQMAMARTGG